MKKILIADDDIDLLSSLAELLNSEGYYITAVKSLQELLKILEKEKYDICILDLVYKGEGIADVYEIPKRFPKTKFIIISGYTGGLKINVLENLGVKVLSKPFKLSELIALIEDSKLQ